MAIAGDSQTGSFGKGVEYLRKPRDDLTVDLTLDRAGAQHLALPHLALLG